MLICVCTSQPHTVSGALKAISSQLRQTVPPDRILWFLPYRNLRLGIDYPDVPAWARSIPSLEIVRCQDYGPATKFVPLLDRADVQPRDNIVIFDDDREYDERSIERLLRSQRQCPHKRASFGFWGHHFRYVPFMHSKRGPVIQSEFSELNRVFVLLGTAQILTRRSWLPSSSQVYIREMLSTPRLFLNDDHGLAQHWFRSKTRLYVVPSAQRFADTEQPGMLSYTNSTLRCEFDLICRNWLPIPWLDAITVIVAVQIILLLFKCRPKWLLRP